MSERRTIAGAYDRLAAHEAQCTLRYVALERQGEDLARGMGDLVEELAAIQSGIRWVIKGVATIGLSLIVWLALQLYGYVQRDIAHNREAAAAAAAHREPGGRL